MLKKSCPDVTIYRLDGEPKVLRIAKRKEECARTQINFKEGMSFKLPYTDESFDRVISSFFFHHLTTNKTPP